MTNAGHSHVVLVSIKPLSLDDLAKSLKWKTYLMCLLLDFDAYKPIWWTKQIYSIMTPIRYAYITYVKLSSCTHSHVIHGLKHRRTQTKKWKNLWFEWKVCESFTYSTSVSASSCNRSNENIKRKPSKRIFCTGTSSRAQSIFEWNRAIPIGLLPFINLITVFKRIELRAAEEGGVAEKAKY